MTHASPTSTVVPDDIDLPRPEVAVVNRALARWMAPLEALSAALMVAIVVMLFGGVAGR